VLQEVDRSKAETSLVPDQVVLVQLAVASVEVLLHWAVPGLLLNLEAAAKLDPAQSPRRLQLVEQD
jgi:hypothetical protein